MQSFSLTTFSPSGKLIQIEHALAAVGQGTTSLGIKVSRTANHLSSWRKFPLNDQRLFNRVVAVPGATRHPSSHSTSSMGLPLIRFDPSNGIVLATSKKPPSPLVDDSMLEKASPIAPFCKGCRFLARSHPYDNHHLSYHVTYATPILPAAGSVDVSLVCPNIGLVYSGMGPDFRVLVAKARKSAQSYWKIYGEYPSTRVMVGEIASVMQDATQSGGVRPYGVSLLVAGYDKAKGHTLYQVDPSGAFWAWKASAIGKNQVNAKTFLEKRSVARSRRPSSKICFSDIFLLVGSRSYNDDLSLEDAIHTALLTLKEGFEGVMTEKTIELGIISTAGFEGAQHVLGAHGTGSTDSPCFRKLTEQEVAE
ncbi:BQ5605_C019g08823 [Microbotryum silenes-dioicae]|uniref:BQ5605_C019g08823 protein n=1 Tax=Microbotryum silenes-dioicae TaxID=796604 RepID=A0A2X0NZT5_9BASI|nr:BQ5605_C019g08823 [Microbotryum silenes-dioicae]